MALAVSALVMAGATPATVTRRVLSSAPAELVTAIRKVMSGGQYVSESLAERLAVEVSGRAVKAPHEMLSDREYQVFLRIAAGRTTREISTALALSVKTVGTYRSRIFEKLGLRGAAELAAYAVRTGLLE